MKFSEGNTEDRVYESPSVGSHNAVLIQCIDLGTQVQMWEGEEKRANKVLLVWELDEKMKDGRPFVTHREFTTSLHEKAALRTFLEAWRGSKFTPEQLKAFDLSKLIGQGAILSLVLSKNAKYVNVASASKLMAGMTKIAPVNPTFYFDMDEFNQVVFDGIWPWVQKKIQASPQYDALMNPSKAQEPEPDFDDGTDPF